MLTSLETVTSMLRRMQRLAGFPPLRATLLLSLTGVTALVAVGCASDHAGSMLERIGGVSVGARPIRPGVEIGMLYVNLRNTSKATLTIRSIGLRGPGTGLVVKVVEVKIVTDRVGYRATGTG